MRVAIFGAGGFIGANLARFFSKTGFEVYPFVHKTMWRLAGLDNTQSLDITDRTETAKRIKALGADVAINCAIYGGYPTQNDRQRIYEVNLFGLMNVLDACMESGVPLFLQTSTSAEYGLKKTPMKETMGVDPQSDYALSKAMATQYCLQRASGGHTKIITFRIFSAYGYYEEKPRLIPQLILNSLDKGEVQLSRPNNVRDFVFADDICSAYDLAVKKQGRLKSGSIYNIGFGKQYRLEQVVKIYKSIDKNVRAKWNSEPGRIEDRAVKWQADITKIRKQLGWKPHYDLHKGLDLTRDWFTENRMLYDK